MISSLYLQHFSGAQPDQLAINGRNNKTGKTERYVLDLNHA
jgi:hypothetical protein